MSTTTPNLGLFKYDPTTDGKEVFSITTALNNNWDILDERCGSSRNIGEIVASTIPLTDAGLHLLDGALIDGSGSYSEFVDYIAGLYTSGNYSSMFYKESTWQTSVSTYGICGKFVYDSTNNTVRLPKIIGKIDGTNDLTALGKVAKQSIKLPNITGDFNASQLHDGSAVGNGAFVAGGSTSKKTPTSDTDDSQNGFSFDASRCSSVYSGDGNNTKIHEQATNVLYYIVVASSAKTDIQVDIEEIATDLNGKADVDLTNISTSCKPIDGQWKYKNTNILSNATGTGESSYSYSLASYLPNDNYNYEVQFYMYGATGTTSGNGLFAWLGSDLTGGSGSTTTGKFQVLRVRSQASTAQYTGATFTLPIGTGRTIYLYLSNEANVTGLYLQAKLYRRIGTNA